ncbi:MAG: hypothetical protein ACYS9X_06110 [Planctomycetota bacterium]|jgi:hypothetical protein
MSRIRIAVLALIAATGCGPAPSRATLTSPSRGQLAALARGRFAEGYGEYLRQRGFSDSIKPPPFDPKGLSIIEEADGTVTVGLLYTGTSSYDVTHGVHWTAKVSIAADGGATIADIQCYGGPE